MKATVEVSVEEGVKVVAIDIGRGVLRLDFEVAKALALAMGGAALAQSRYGRFEIEMSGAGRC